MGMGDYGRRVLRVAVPLVILQSLLQLLTTHDVFNP